MAKGNSVIIRSDKDFANMIKSLQAVKLQKNKRFVKTSRITKAIMNQYRRHPQLYMELEAADLL